MNRRGHGEGSIHRRADGYWTAVLDLGHDGGSRRRKQLYGKTRREVADKLREAQRLLGDGRLPTGKRQTVAQFLVSWLEGVKPSVRPKTYDDYRRLIVTHIVPGLGSHDLTKLTPAMVQRFYASKLAVLSPRSVEYLHAILHRALGRAERWGLITRNPASATLVDVPRPQKHEIQPLSTDQARAFLAVAEQHRLGALWSLALRTGMRQGEILGLRWCDLDAELAQVTVRRTVQRVGGETIVGEPKSSASRRAIPIAPPAAIALRRWRAQQKAEFLRLGLEWGPDTPTFTSDEGTLLIARSVLAAFKRLLVTAGLPPIRFHDLRHTTASILLAEGVHPKIVQELLGHSQIAMTMDVYSHLMPGQREGAVGALSRALA